MCSFIKLAFVILLDGQWHPSPIACTTRPHGQGRIQGVCLAVMTDPFVSQVLNINANKISNVATAGL